MLKNTVKLFCWEPILCQGGSHALLMKNKKK